MLVEDLLTTDLPWITGGLLQVRSDGLEVSSPLSLTLRFIGRRPLSFADPDGYYTLLEFLNLNLHQLSCVIREIQQHNCIQLTVTSKFYFIFKNVEILLLLYFVGLLRRQRTSSILLKIDSHDSFTLMLSEVS